MVTGIDISQVVIQTMVVPPMSVGLKDGIVPLYMSHLNQRGTSISYRACMPSSAACSTATNLARSRRGREL